VSGDTTPNRKPHPEPILHACAQLAVDPASCVYVGDAERDIEAGRRAGTATLAATFGYLQDREDPARWGADALVDAPLDLLAWLDLAPHG
jgi:phosphoglycolate phosphatase